MKRIQWRVSENVRDQLEFLRGNGGFRSWDEFFTALISRWEEKRGIPSQEEPLFGFKKVELKLDELRKVLETKNDNLQRCSEASSENIQTIIESQEHSIDLLIKIQAFMSLVASLSEADFSRTERTYINPAQEMIRKAREKARSNPANMGPQN
jgi:hypothetical protein